jgi:hypothetical protein
MNTLESCLIVNPENITDECAQFLIDDTATPFVLSEILTVGTRYTFSFWIRSEQNSTITACGKAFTSTPNWQKYVATFTATSTDLVIGFLNVGTYQLYHPKLEIGNIPTDWSPAPEDLDDSDKIAEITGATVGVYEYFNDVIYGEKGINTVVGIVKEMAQKDSDALNGDGGLIKQFSELNQTTSGLTVSVTNITTNGVDKVKTVEYGFTFDDNGMMIDSSDSVTKTKVDTDGMTVYKKDADNNAAPVLIANNEGVEAIDLSANTYLIIGGRSRFENYTTNNSNRTGCFWIGG